MHPSSRLTRVGVALTAAGTLVVPALAASALPAGAQPQAGPSTPVPIVAPEGQTMSYVVNVATVNHGQIRKAERAVVAAGGTVIQRYEEIGVLVVQSTRSSFLQALRAGARNTISSAGPTRTVPVKEAPGAGVGRPVPPGHRKLADFEGLYTGSPSAPAAGLDPMEPDQWNNRLIRADEAHRITDGDRKVTVAIVDSGIEANHPDLQANIVPALSVNCTVSGVPQSTGWEATTSSHGTHVAGTVAAARNGVGIVGVAPAVKLASVKVVNDDGFIYPEYALCGIMWTAAKQIPVANHSYFVDPFVFWCDDQPGQRAVKTSMRRAFTWSTGRGMVNVAAAGNSGLDLTHKTVDSESPTDARMRTRRINAGCTDMPTELPGVVSVSAVDRTRELAPYSNDGLGIVDVAAPGDEVLSTVPGGKYAVESGTSMAAPHAAGVLALIASRHPKFTPTQLTATLKKQARPLPCATDSGCRRKGSLTSYYGHGLVDALAAVK